VPAAGLAQVNLGRMYAKGRGVPQDYVTAHMWFSLAIGRGVEKRQKIAKLWPRK
jgi:uncharacterized protein